MARYPAVQVRAQKELDSVLGRSTLPSLSDRENRRLPYIDALIKEVLRWNSALPLGVPHVCTEDDEYSGYKIPKGAVVLPNVWCVIFRDTILSSLELRRIYTGR